MKTWDHIYDFITSQESGFQNPVALEDGWSWSLKEHLRRSYLYKNSQFERDNDDRELRPFKNIVRAILNVQYRTEGFDVKDIELYVDSADEYWKSFLVKKFHEKWALDNELDTFIDELVESYVDYGGVLVKNVKGIRPEVVSLRSLAFCDQTDLLSGPFAIKHYLSPEQLREKADVGWGLDSNHATMSLEMLITLSENKKQQDKNRIYSNTPGNYIEVYEVHGTFPNNWVKGEDDKYTPQMHIVAFYKNQDNKDVGVTLFASREPKLPFKFLARDNVDGRALGFGGIEELFESQVWTNFSQIQIMEMLSSAAKILFKSTDPAFKTRNNLSDVDNLEVLTLQEGRDITQLDTSPRNLAVFNDALDRWELHAQSIGAAPEPLLGETPSSGTPFKLYEAQLIEGKSLHQWRQGKIAVFVDEIYRDWVLPYLTSEIAKDQEFLTELSSDEFQKVAQEIVNNLAAREQIEQVLNGEIPEDMELLKQKHLESFTKGGSKRFMKIFKGELKDKPLGLLTNIKGKQKNLALLTDKVVNILRQFIATPQLRQDPEMVKLLNVILESSGLSPILFGASPVATLMSPGGATEPLQDLAQSNKQLVQQNA